MCALIASSAFCAEDAQEVTWTVAADSFYSIFATAASSVLAFCRTATRRVQIDMRVCRRAAQSTRYTYEDLLSDLGKEFDSWQQERAKKRGRKSESFGEFFEDITDEFLTFLEGGLAGDEGGGKGGGPKAGGSAAAAQARADSASGAARAGARRAQERAQAGAQSARQQAEAGAERARQSARQGSYDVDQELAELKKRMGL